MPVSAIITELLLLESNQLMLFVAVQLGCSVKLVTEDGWDIRLESGSNRVLEPLEGCDTLEIKGVSSVAGFEVLPLYQLVEFSETDRVLEPLVRACDGTTVAFVEVAMDDRVELEVKACEVEFRLAVEFQNRSTSQSA